MEKIHSGSLKELNKEARKEFWKKFISIKSTSTKSRIRSYLDLVKDYYRKKSEIRECCGKNRLGIT